MKPRDRGTVAANNKSISVKCGKLQAAERFQNDLFTETNKVPMTP